MLKEEIEDKIISCTHDIDELLTQEQIEGFETTLNELEDLFKKAQRKYTAELPKIAKAIKTMIEECARDIDRFLTKEEISNFESTLNNLWDLFKKELHWYAVEAPRIAKEKKFNLDPFSNIVLPEGYKGMLTEYDMGTYVIWKIGKDGKEDKKVGTFMAQGMTPKGILRVICEFEEKEKSQ